MATKFSMSLDDNYGSTYFNIKNQAIPTTPITTNQNIGSTLAKTPTSSSSSSSITAILAAAANIASTSSLKCDDFMDDSILMNNIHNLTDDEDDDIKAFNLRLKQQQQQQQSLLKQFSFNESLELDDEIIFNNPSIKSSPPPQPPLIQQQQDFLTTNIKCVYKKCYFNDGYKSLQQKQQQQQHDNVFIQFYCTNPKCKDFKIFFHNLCYDTALNEFNFKNTNKKQRARSNSLEYSNLTFNNQTELNCMNCHSGYLKMFKPLSTNMPSPPPPQSTSSSSSSSSSVSPPLDHSSKQKQQQQQQQQFTQYLHNNNNNNQFSTSSSPINIIRSNNMLRKRSIGGLNNPPLPTPMQPLHESEAISTSPPPSQPLTTVSTLTPMCNTNSTSNKQQYMKNHQYKFKQSAPVNMPNTNNQQQQQQQNRYRTLSCGSTGSFSASSSFSSSMGTSPVVINQNTNLWKKMLNSTNPSSSYISTSGNYTGTSCSNSSVNSICTYRGNDAFRNNNNNNNNESILSQTTTTLQPTSLSTPTTTTQTVFNNNRLEIFDEKLASSGNMFYKRIDSTFLNSIPTYKQNSMHIRLEDEGPYGNDEIRCYVLSHFSALCVRDIKCVLCNDNLKLYDRFPLTDGTLFLSPFIYDKTKAINAGITNKEQYIYGVCLKCLNNKSNNNNNIKCKWCKQEWKSESLQIGTLYKYDIFAAFPCCQKRVCCNKCNKSIIDLNINEINTINNNNNNSGIVSNGSVGGLPYFSSYSEEIECPHCKLKAYHFIKPLDMLFKT